MDETDATSQPAEEPRERRSTPALVLGVIVVVELALISLLSNETGIVSGPLILLGGALVIFGWRRHRRLAITGIVVMIAGPIVVHAASLAFFVWSITRQVPLAQDEWPQTLSVLASDTAVPARDVQAVSLGGFLDTAKVWRLPVQPAKLSEAVRGLEATEVAVSRVPSDFRGSFPRHMQPPESPSNRYFMTPGFPAEGERGQDGLYHLAMYDAATHLLYVLEVDNF